jgi:hypothetical protein
MTLIRNIAIAAVVVAAAVSSGFLAPDHVVVTREASTKASPADVLSLAASSDGYQTFNPYKASDPALKITPFGPRSGVGAGFDFDGKDGRGKQTLVGLTPDRADFEVYVDGMGVSTQAIAATPAAQGATVVWSMRVELGDNPMMRLIGLIMPALISPTLDAGVTRLAEVAERG